MSDNDFVCQAVARAKQIAAKLGAGGDATTPTQNNGNIEQPSYAVSAPPMIGTKRPASDTIVSQPVEKRSMVTDKLSAAAEAAAKINEKLGGSYGNNNPLANQTLTIIHKIPDKYVGLVIGKKGEQIIQLQADSQCKVVISQEGGAPERELTMTGTQAQIDKAKSLINEIVERAGGTVAGGTSNICSIDVMIPGLKAGLVIGKNGETIKQLQESTGAKMVLIQESNTPTADDKPLRITGDSEAVEKAKNMVIGLLANKDGSFSRVPKAMPRMPFQQQNAPESGDLCVYAVPTEKAGLIIGKGGETIREICGRSGAFVEISKQQAADPGIKLFNIRGQRHEIDSAIRFISERAGIPVGPPQSYTQGAGSGYGMMNPGNMGRDGGYYPYQHQPQPGWPGYGNPQPHGQPPYSHPGAQQGWHGAPNAPSGQGAGGGPMPPPTINPNTGQPDYSAAWAEYYRRQGMHEYADMILRQAQQTNPAFQASAIGAAVTAAGTVSNQITSAASTAVMNSATTAATASSGSGQGAPGQYDYNSQWHQWHQWQQQQQQQQMGVTGSNPSTVGNNQQQSNWAPPQGR